MSPMNKLAALNRVLSQAQKSVFYQDCLPRRPIKSLSEFKEIPLTFKEKLRNCSPIDLLCVSKTELYQYHETFGTTGLPISIWYTKADFERSSQSLTEWGVGFRPGDLVLVRFPYAISTIAHLVHAAAQSQGACVIPASSRSVISPFSRIIKLLHKLEVTILACLPLQALLLAETAQLLGYRPSQDFPALRAVCTAGEALPPERRKLIEEIWQVPVYDNYGMTEIGPATLDCAYQVNHPLEEDFYLEILAADLTSEVEPGQTGYLVMTTLNRAATPLIRYFTGDQARLLPSDCPCGKKLSLEIRGRQEDSILIGKRLLNRWDLEKLISTLPCRRFWVAGPSVQGLQIIVEKEKPDDELSPDTVRQISEEWQLPLQVEIVPTGTLYDRNQLLEVGLVGKPRYIYTAEEMANKTYLHSIKT